MTRSLAAAAALCLMLASAAAQTPTVTVTIPGKAYSPSDVSVLVGTTVTWRNEDAGNHTVTADDGSFDSGYIAPGGTFTHTFDKPGIHRLHCAIHRFMKGVVRVYSLVLNGPQAAVGAGRHIVFTGLAPSASTTVALQRRGPGGGWTTIASHHTRADGGYTFAATAAAPASYRAVAGTATSPVLRLAVFPHVTARVTRGRLAVATLPARPRARLVLQTYDRERFTFFTIAHARLTANGRAVLSLSGLHGQHVRVVVRGSHGWSDGVSPVFVVQ